MLGFNELLLIRLVAMGLDLFAAVILPEATVQQL